MAERFLRCGTSLYNFDYIRQINIDKEAKIATLHLLREPRRYGFDEVNIDGKRKDHADCFKEILEMYEPWRRFG